MYIPEKRVSEFKEMINAGDLSDEMKEFVFKSFDKAFDYTPVYKRSNVYTHDTYLKMKERHGGNLSRLECNVRARKKYDDKNREEINRKARERYRKKKLLKEQQDIASIVNVAINL